jgi:hypothetical protein
MLSFSRQKIRWCLRSPTEFPRIASTISITFTPGEEVGKREKTKIGDAKATGRKKKKEDREEEENDQDEEKGEEEEVVRRKKRSNKDDNDFDPEERSKKMDDMLVTSSGRRIRREQVMSGLKKRNQTLEGSWVFQDCDDADSDLVLKLSKDGKSMSGYCVITGCKVRLRCNELFNLQDLMQSFMLSLRPKESILRGEC